MDSYNTHLSANRIKSTSGWSVLVFLSNIASFVCICKVWNNLANKVSHPYLLSQGWMIALCVSLGVFWLSTILNAVATKSEMGIGMFALTTVTALVPSIMIACYLGGKIQPSTIETVIKIASILAIISFALIGLALCCSCCCIAAGIAAGSVGSKNEPSPVIPTDGLDNLPPQPGNLRLPENSTNVPLFDNINRSAQNWSSQQY